MVEKSSQQVVFPNLRYLDPKGAIEFLTGAFGFVPHFVVAADDGGVEHAQVLAGSNLIFLSREHPDDRYGMHSPQVLNGTAQALCIRVPDDTLDPHQTRAEASGARILNPIHDSLAGVREYTCADPEGQLWTFSSYAGE